ncbi:2-amino-4-hydroxy-6-hydroxymethyldihydropteridine diphosphokinase [Gracilimonas sediminicola]|uniref:2-amino-4-hydroxy-6-hydroxymethyldihydropteridine pyrophosphokinase n=1 Tax=Gracilimonas sediminicola TaxID=2952158 RepID=A0A9X2L2C0_9BACT|nr:2-amino-4-hydroxy-6-hydroxymethyldihydropteridine diphosphokinase [Gracilimonas sediminicola]MCP9290932.1 2-amino-4-hydroxy-6-hydroxymethyldihydropteridine diphosphokinase [Gracilimonas sediminicola]
MAQVVIALGSNLHHPHRQLQKAASFLESLSENGILTSVIYKSEPVGPSENDFLNGVIVIQTELPPEQLFIELKAQEKKQGRPSRYPKWTARTIDLDIIAYDNLVVETDTLIIPHQEYTRRLFVLLPLKDIFPDWKDPVSAQHVDTLIEQAPDLEIVRTTLNW